jgi:hypothetical protein
MTITCLAEGYRPIHSVALTKDDSTVKNWVPSTDCTAVKFYNFSYVYIMALRVVSSYFEVELLIVFFITHVLIYS